MPAEILYFAPFSWTADQKNVFQLFWPFQPWKPKSCQPRKVATDLNGPATKFGQAWAASGPRLLRTTAAGARNSSVLSLRFFLFHIKSNASTGEDVITQIKSDYQQFKTKSTKLINIKSIRFHLGFGVLGLSQVLKKCTHHFSASESQERGGRQARKIGAALEGSATQFGQAHFSSQGSCGRFQFSGPATGSRPTDSSHETRSNLQLAKNAKSGSRSANFLRVFGVSWYGRSHVRS